MSKELEALNILRDNHIQFTKEKYGQLDKEKLQNIINRKLARWDILEQALKRNEPMKVKRKTYTNGFFKRFACSICDTTIQKEFVCCPYCRQELDWSDEK